MARTLILIYATLAVFLIILLSSTPKSPYSFHRRSHRSLKLRTPTSNAEEKTDNGKGSTTTYPRLPPAPGHEAQTEWEGFVNAEDYINDEKRFNVTDRLVVLFPNIDLGPADGFLTVGELTEWNVRHALKETMHGTQRDFEVHDKNKDGFVSLEEYEVPSWARRPDGANSSGWWEEKHFKASDVDGDDMLNFTEFNERVSADTNKDRRLSLQETIENPYVFYSAIFDDDDYFCEASSDRYLNAGSTDHSSVDVNLAVILPIICWMSFKWICLPLVGNSPIIFLYVA